ncbi:hypothetical protein GLOIN_2v1479937 [Rhizophagus irregularis DAOM 181602=DAOM 197198]|nr:hypothetical protein GLOIN_2v1479937 [Rhizophagus irregularis DAOM 181602=DAOM 197198]
MKVLIQNEILLGGKFSGMAVQEINESFEFNFFERGMKSEKKLMIITKGYEDVIRARGIQLVNNKQNDSKKHTPFAFLEK